MFFCSCELIEIFPLSLAQLYHEHLIDDKAFFFGICFYRYKRGICLLSELLTSIRFPRSTVLLVKHHEFGKLTI